METFSALLALCVGNSPVTGEFPTQRPVTRSFDVIFDLRLNKLLSKQSRSWWFDTPSHLLWLSHYWNIDMDEKLHSIVSCTCDYMSEIQFCQWWTLGTSGRFYSRKFYVLRESANSVVLCATCVFSIIHCLPWDDMMASSNGNIFRVTGHLCGEFTGLRWIPRTKVTRTFDVFFDLRLNKRLSKQSRGWWFETPSCPLWRHCDEMAQNNT